jgi:hypothetical protein
MLFVHTTQVLAVSLCYFDALVHSTPLVNVLTVSTTYSTYWCRPVCTLTWFVHPVSTDRFDAFVQFTHFAVVFVHHPVSDCAYCAAIFNTLFKRTTLH